ncbi:MAG: hypothetical protein LBH13_05670 [Cellulomonadaceae bacterium]|nr:hypothetical protein [Cellulomonadaceae bacterium]
MNTHIGFPTEEAPTDSSNARGKQPPPVMVVMVVAVAVLATAGTVIAWHPWTGTTGTAFVAIIAPLTAIVLASAAVITYKQRSVSDDRAAWYQRVRDAKEDILSESENRQQVGRRHLALCAASSLSGPTEVGIIEAIEASVRTSFSQEVETPPMPPARRGGVE